MKKWMWMLCILSIGCSLASGKPAVKKGASVKQPSKPILRFLAPGVGAAIPPREKLPDFGSAPMPPGILPGVLPAVPAGVNTIIPQPGAFDNTNTATPVVGAVSPMLRLEPMRVDLLRRGDNARFTAVVQNPTSSVMHVGLVGGRTSEAMIIPAGQTVRLPISAPAPSTTPGNFDLPVKALVGDKVIARVVAVIGVPENCKYAVRTIRINGDLGEWGDAVSLALSPAGEARISARVMIAWDEDRFYIAISEKDEGFSAEFLPEEMLRGDNVQIAFDTARGSKNFVPIVLGIARGRIHGICYRFSGGNGPGTVDAARVSVRRDGNRTIYEASIPWSEIGGFRARADGLLGFAMRINDPDGHPTGALAWADGITPTPNPNSFYPLRLIK